MDDIERIAERIAELQASREPDVARFDEPGALEGPVAVLPSAFNPPTAAHVALLREAAGDAHPAAMLSTRNVDKGLYGAALHHRVGMLLASRPSHGAAVLASNEARIPDQAAALRHLHPAATIDIIVGYDTLVRVFDGRYYEDLRADLEGFFRHHRLIAANRGEATVDVVRAFLDDPLVRDFRERIIVREIHPEAAAMSSTLARRTLPDNPDAGLVPREVAAYIRAHRLYVPDPNP